MSSCSRATLCKSGGDCAACASTSAPRPLHAFSKHAPPGAIALPNVRHVIFVMSGKGGVGKSAVTVNIASVLAGKGHKVGILDVDIHGPSIPGLLGIKERLRPGNEKMLAPVGCGKNLAAVSIDSLLEDRDEAIIWRGPRKTAAIRQFISGVDWRDLDFLLID